MAFIISSRLRTCIAILENRIGRLTVDLPLIRIVVSWEHKLKSQRRKQSVAQEEEELRGRMMMMMMKISSDHVVALQLLLLFLLPIRVFDLLYH